MSEKESRCPSAEKSNMEKMLFPEKPKKRDEILNDTQLCELRKIIYKIYTVDREIPTLNKILVAARQQLNYDGSKTLLRKLLSEKLSFKFKICKNNGPLPVERHKVALNRIQYLTQLRDNELLGPNKKHVVYLDEISIKCKKDVDKNDFEEKWYLLYAGNEEGFIKCSKLLKKSELTKKGTYPKNMSKVVFINWVKNLLIPSLPTNSIVILDNAPQHNKEIEVIPDEFSTKQEIEAWLQKHNIEFKNDLIRPELLMLVKKNLPENNYVADEIIQAAGHKVLRLPIYMDLNPMENVLQRVKEKVAEQLSSQSGSDIESVVDEVLASITDEDWIKEIEQVKDLERKYLENENLLDNETDRLEISFEESEGDMFSSDTNDYITDFSYETSDTSEESIFNHYEGEETDEFDNEKNDSYSV